MAEKKNNKLVTFTGVPADQISTELAKTFDLDAFKPLEHGGAGLSDINTGYMIERITLVFGPKGLGWNLLYASDDMKIYGNPEPGHKYNPILAWLKNARFVYYLFTDGESDPVEAPEIITSGTSVNDQPYAEEGARTNATGAAIKWLMFQNELYKGVLDAKIGENAGNRRQQSRTRNAPKPKTTNKKPPAQQKKQPDKPKLTALERALAYSIPDGLPHASEPLKVLLDNGAAGVGILSYLAGQSANPEGDLFVAETEDDKKLMAAAEYILTEKVDKEKEKSE